MFATGVAPPAPGRGPFGVRPSSGPGIECRYGRGTSAKAFAITLASRRGSTTVAFGAMLAPE